MQWTKTITAGMAVAAMLSTGYAENPLTKLVRPETEEKTALVPPVALTNILQQVTGEIEQAGTNSDSRVQIEKLRQIKSLIEERLSLTQAIDHTAAASETDLPAIPSLSGYVSPYPLALLDDLRHAQRLRERAIQNLRVLADATESELERTRKIQLSREREYRLLAESKNPVADRQQQLTLLQLDARVAEQQAGLQQLRFLKTRTSLDTLKNEQAVLQEQMAVLGRHIEFSRKAYNEQRLKIDQREANIKNLLFIANLELQQVNLRGAATEFPAVRMRVLRREVETLEERLQLIPDARLAWERRFALYNARKNDSLHRSWSDEARQQTEQVDRLLGLRLLQYNEATAASREQTDEEKVGDNPRSRIVDLLDSSVTALQRTITLNQNLQDDFTLLYGQPSVGSQIWNRLRLTASSLWNFELKNIDGRPITVRKVIYAILLILAGLKMVGLLSHRLVNRLLGKLRMEESSIASISTLLFYFFSVIVVVIALGVANIPLTLFTLLGGALAIGVGFGSQTIINNFISGLILLVERPIRKGDMVEVGNTTGRVDRVGLRCTQVRTFQNVDIMVPNSAFLENNVVNLTLSDDRYKAELYVGVIYGSPTRRVKELILQAAIEHEKVLPHPAPEIMFTDFGDNALIFRLYAWVHMRQPSDRDRVLSDLRFRIDELFRAEGLVIAYPQRDVHLDTIRPLEVRLVDRAPGDAAP